MDDREAAEVGARHVAELGATLAQLDLGRLGEWGSSLARDLAAGHRLLVAGNGGSAAEAQHLTAELVGRFEGERRPLAAIALHAETSALTAIANDYGYDEVFARQVRAFGRPGDVFLGLSTSGNSPSVCHAATEARSAGLRTWALTGRGPNELLELVDEAIAVPAGSAATVQECHLVMIHLLCRFLDAALAEDASGGQGGG